VATHWAEVTLRVEVEGQLEAVGVERIGLVEDRPAARELERVLVAEAAHAAERPEVGVEGAVLLHEDDDVLDRPEAATARTDLPECIEYASGTERARADSDSGGEQLTSR
jgi:hypothetical protein